jgi:DNA-binding CsgD family transcriptional regulator
MRVAPTVILDSTSRIELERLSRKRSLAARVVVRSRIILLAADGLQNRQIAAELGMSTRMAAVAWPLFIARHPRLA